MKSLSFPRFLFAGLLIVLAYSTGVAQESRDTPFYVEGITYDSETVSYTHLTLPTNREV